MLSKTELTKEVRNRLWSQYGLSVTKIQVNYTISAVIDAICDELANGNDVYLPGLGKLKVKQFRERAGRNPRTGEPIRIPAKQKVVFYASKGMKEDMKEDSE